MTDKSGFGGYNMQSYSYHSPNDSLSNDFNRVSQSIGTNIQKITQNVSQMQRMINQIGSQYDTPELRDKLHQLQHYTNQLAKETNQTLKELVNLPQSTSSSEQRQRKMLKDRLMNEFTSALSNFQLAQRQEKEKERASVNQSKTHVDPFADDRKSDDQLVAFESPGTIQMEEDVDVEVLREREQSIRQLEADIMDVNQIFKDLGMLVHEQGDVIDSIEANVESAAINIEHGTEELSHARNYQSKVRRKRCCLLLLFLVILSIIIIIIAVSVSR